jgi:hypothetical protein
VMYVSIACRCALGLVFLVSAVSKLRGFAAFADSVRDIGAVPPGMIRAVALAVTLAECATVPLLAAAPIAGSLVAAGLLVGFSATIALVLRRGATVVCRCFGSSTSVFARRHLVRNALLLTVAMVGLMTTLYAPGIDDLGAVAVAVVAGLLAALPAITFDDLVALFAPTRLSAAGAPPHQP